MKSNPPKRALQFLRWFCREDCLEEIEGDLTEVFIKQAEISPRKAKWKFTWSVIKYFRPEFLKPLKNNGYNPYGMYKSYFKVGWRNLWRSKSFSVINISGLAIGIAVTMIIGLWVLDELSFNRSFEKFDRLGTIYLNIVFDGDIISDSGAPHAMGRELKEHYPEFEDVAVATYESDHILEFENKNLSRTGLCVEPQFLEMFSIRLIAGDKHPLKEMHSIILSESLADALLGENPVGKMIKLDNQIQFVVSGIFEDFPSNSEFRNIQMLMPLDYHFTTSSSAEKQRNNWEDISFQCFVLFNDGVSLDAVNTKIKGLLFEKGSNDMKSLKPECFVFPMAKWHLYSEFKDGENVGGQIQMVWMFGIVGSIVLVLACINFTNLSTARSNKRSKEVGIRKVLGSIRKQVANQFLVESFLIVALAFIVAMGIVFLSLPWFNSLADKNISIPIFNPYFLLMVGVFLIITSLLAGSYPALYLSSFNPVRVLKGTYKIGRYASIPRQVMVVFQFSISTILIIVTVNIFQQIQYAKDRPVGFDRDGIIQLNIRTPDLAKANYNTLRNDLLSTGVVENMAKSYFSITGGASADGSLTWDGKNPTTQTLVALNSCSHDFPKTNGFQFIEGRDFSRELVSDSSAIIINEMASKILFEGNAIGKKVRFQDMEKEIIGVIKDQVRWTPFSKQTPHMYFVKYNELGCLTIRLKSNVDISGALSTIESVIKKYDAGAPCDYEFQDDEYAKLFENEERIGKLSRIFASLAILISCLGIFGLASFMAVQRTKEIGIRKVLGASAFRMWRLLSTDFIWLVIITVILSAPIAYYLSDEWLLQYDYRIQISWTTFVWTSLGLFLITLVTVSFQSVKAALMNPVNTLKSE